MAPQAGGNPSATLHFLLQKQGRVAIISGEQGRFTTPQTRSGDVDLRQELQSLGYQPVSTMGKYGDYTERSQAIRSPRNFAALRALGQQFAQESVLYRDNDTNQYVYVNGPYAGCATKPAQGVTTYDQEPQDAYTAVLDDQGKPHTWYSYNVNFPPKGPDDTDLPKDVHLANGDLVPWQDPADEALGQDLQQDATQDPTGTDHLKTEQRLASEFRLIKSAVESYQEVLLGLRMRELAKAEQGERVATHREPGIHEPSGQPHTEPGIHEKPAQPAQKDKKMAKSIHDLLKSQVMRKSEGTPKKCQCPGDCGKVLKTGEVPKKCPCPGDCGCKKLVTKGEVSATKCQCPGDCGKVLKTGEVPKKCPCPAGCCKVLSVVKKGACEGKCGGSCGQCKKSEKACCKTCKSEMGPVAKALSKTGDCGKCLKSAIEKGEVKAFKANPCKEVSTGTGCDIDDKKKLRKDATKMTTPAAPKPPQAPGANPTLHKALGEPLPRAGRAPVPVAPPAGIGAPHPAAVAQAGLAKPAAPAKPQAGLPKPPGVKVPPSIAGMQGIRGFIKPQPTAQPQTAGMKPPVKVNG